MSASAKVFGTVDLREQILLELPFRDLLLVQRTRKCILGIIQGSRQIQQALFLEPSTISRRDWRRIGTPT
ncbi:hypothetical protein BAUCODRAFT_38636 [Baudoinia panamericana UAMH 10762]|uniref:F-box domain-containing protein n=1 Tax=Baudoinia panamericana (strain UAMH 10762) TaxID=717646 RepID=M2M4L0_BAUPA|nr:uncharacterized protein BAUCODRAFT_38636 [Baudoinia panamericana UAMH 10762]EMC91526.1 hypothetical protein BAUCODRAFT_38636 [Baudoinia panamericana UAMH 10762]